MEEQVQAQKTSAGQIWGIIGLCVGIISIPLSFISCFLWYPIIFAVLGLALAVVGLVQASKNNGKKGLIIAALIISVAGTALSASWYFMFTKPAMEILGSSLDSLDIDLKNAINSELDSSSKEFENALDDAMKESELTVDSAITTAGDKPK